MLSRCDFVVAAFLCTKKTNRLNALSKNVDVELLFSWGQTALQLQWLVIVGGLRFEAFRVI